MPAVDLPSWLDESEEFEPATILPETAPSLPPLTGASFFLRITRDGHALGKLRFDSGPVRIGRSPECEARLDDPTASRFHAVIEVSEQGTFRVRDMQSSNGVRLNGRSVEESPLHDGDTIQIGDHYLRFEWRMPEVHGLVEDSDPEEVRDVVFGRTLSVRPSKAETDQRERSLPQRAYLRGEPGAGRQGARRPLQYILDRDVFLIGRGAESDLRLGGLFTSRVAAVIVRGPSGFSFQPVATRWGWGSRVNNVPASRQRPLRSGDRIEVGGEVFTFHEASR